MIAHILYLATLLSLAIRIKNRENSKQVAFHYKLASINQQVCNLYMLDIFHEGH